MSRRLSPVGFGFLGAVFILLGGLAGQPLVGAAPPAVLTDAQPPLPLSDADAEHFLATARVVKTKAAGKGVTGSVRATLSDGTLTHDAHIQTIDEAKTEFRGTQGTELNFKDTYAFNVAAYKIDRLIGLNMVPVTVARRHGTSRASFTWWIDDVMMDEGERLKKHVVPDDLERWNRQMQLVRLFDQLIANTDRNLQNLVITKDWRLWPIDHTRAFRLLP